MAGKSVLGVIQAPPNPLAFSERTVYAKVSMQVFELVEQAVFDDTGRVMKADVKR